MERAKRKRLEEAGWKTGDAADFLGLSSEESAYLEIRLALAQALVRERKRLRVTQAQLAKRIHSSQSRVAKMETGDASVSIDLQVRTLLSMGISQNQVGRALAGPTRRKPAHKETG